MRSLAITTQSLDRVESKEWVKIEDSKKHRLSIFPVKGEEGLIHKDRPDSN